MQFPDDPALKLGGVAVICPCDAPQLARAVALLDKHGWHVMVQTVDGADVHAAVDAFEHAAGSQSVARTRAAVPASTKACSQTDRRAFWSAATGRPHRSIRARPSKTPSPRPGELRNAIDAYTSHAAYASYDEHRKGTLARGMLADIVILSNDIFESRPEALRETAVTVTIFDGKIVYQRPASQAPTTSCAMPPM